jgi:hypothetical protein
MANAMREGFISSSFWQPASAARRMTTIDRVSFVDVEGK